MEDRIIELAEREIRERHPELTEASRIIRAAEQMLGSDWREKVETGI